AGAGGDQSAGAARLGLAGVEDQEVPGRKMLEAVAPGAQVVHQRNMFDPQLALQVFRLDDPGEVGSANRVVDDRAGNAKSGRFDTLPIEVRSGRADKFAHDQLELREILTGETLLENRRERAALFRKQREVAFGAA